MGDPIKFRCLVNNSGGDLHFMYLCCNFQGLMDLDPKYINGVKHQICTFPLYLTSHSETLNNFISKGDA